MKNLKKTSSVFIVLILIFALLAVTAVRAVDIVATISLKLSGGYYGLAYDSRLGEIFVTNGDYNLVYVISDSSNTVVATIPVVVFHMALLMIWVQAKFLLQTMVPILSQ